MIAEFLSLSLTSQVGILLLAAFLLVGVLVVMTFVTDVLVAAARATSLVALNVAVSRRLPGWFSLVVIASSWRRLLFAFYRDREKRCSYTLTYDDQPVARWRGVFRWESIDSGEQSSGVAE